MRATCRRGGRETKAPKHKTAGRLLWENRPAQHAALICHRRCVAKATRATVALWPPRGQRGSFFGGCHCRRVEQWNFQPPRQARRRDGICPRRRSRPIGWVRAKPKVTIAYRQEPNGPVCDLPSQVQSAEALTWTVLTPLWQESSDHVITRGDV